jgi:hypothetical protein
MDIKEKLDRLYEFQAQRNLIELDKRALLDEVKVPAEVEEVVRVGMEKLDKVAGEFLPRKTEFDKQCDAEYEAIEIPEEIKATLAEVDKKRASIMAKKRDYDMEIGRLIDDKRKEIQAEIEAQTIDVYAAITRRKDEIEAEFAGKADAVDENIKKLTEEIKTDVKGLHYTVTGAHLQARYTKGKKNWIQQRLDAYTETHPDIKDCYTVGEPSVAIYPI